jgi:hypothetical protein
MKFCVDCKHCDQLPENEYQSVTYLCRHPSLGRNIISGIAEVDRCDDRRSIGTCGPDAKHFEPTIWRRLFKRPS